MRLMFAASETRGVLLRRHSYHPMYLKLFALSARDTSYSPMCSSLGCFRLVFATMLSRTFSRSWGKDSELLTSTGTVLAKQENHPELSPQRSIFCATSINYKS